MPCAREPEPSVSLSPLFPSMPWVRAWVWTAAVGSLFLIGVFVGYEVLERLVLLKEFEVTSLFRLHVVRGVGASILLGTWAVFNVWRARREYEGAYVRAYADLERAMHERTRELSRTQAQIRHQEKMAALGVLAAGIAHDIGNPLASMSSELEMLELETDIERVRESVGVLRRQVSRITGAVREMQDFSRRRGEEVTEVSIPAAVEDALRMVRHDPRARKVRMTAQVSPSLPLIKLIEDHLVLVLVNLLINALDAMPDGGDLKVSAAREGAGVAIEVIDTGVGMSAEVKSRALEPLFTTKAKGKGTGLGLSVSADVMREIGGTLDIVSSPGWGTTVRLFIPEMGAGSAAPRTESHG